MGRQLWPTDKQHKKPCNNISKSKSSQQDMAPYHKWPGSPILWRIRDFLVGKTLVPGNRYKFETSPRSVPEANIMPGIHHKLSDNYYGLTQDGRRAHQPPTVVVAAVPKLAEVETDGEAIAEASVKPKLFTPGENYRNM